MILQAYGSGKRKTLFGVLTVMIFHFFFFGCSSRPKADSSVEFSSPKVLVDSKRRVAAFRDFGEVISYVKASNTGAWDYFGVSLSFSGDGNTLAVGAHREDSKAGGVGGDQTNDEAEESGWFSGIGNWIGEQFSGSDQENDEALNSGAVYVFVRDTEGTWSQQAYLKASNTGAEDRFGYSLSFSGDGNSLAVGAYREDSKAGGVGGDQTNNEAEDSGAVYVFVRDTEGTWSQQAYLKASNTGAWDQFGYSLSFSGDGNTLAVGAYREDSKAGGVGGDQTNNEAEDSGAVYVFVRDTEGTWSQQAYLKASNTGVRDWFGYSLSFSGDGNSLAVGAYREDSKAGGVGGDQTNNEAEDSGAVYVFVRDTEGTWSQQAYLKASNTGVRDWFGYSLSFSGDGNSLAVGAYREDSKAGGVGGDQSNDDARDSGAVYVFVRDERTWSQQAYLKASNTGAWDQFGYSLSFSGDGNSLAVGAYREDSKAGGVGGDQSNDDARDSGAVYVFVRDTEGTWSQQAYLKASNTGVRDWFGYSLSFSGDGNSLAVGAHGEDSNARGVGGNQTNDGAQNSGAVYVYLQ